MRWTHVHLVTRYASDNFVFIGSSNGLAPIRRQAITWTNGNLLFFCTSGNTHPWQFNWYNQALLQGDIIRSVIRKYRPFCSGLSVFSKEFLVRNCRIWPLRVEDHVKLWSKVSWRRAFSQNIQQYASEGIPAAQGVLSSIIVVHLCTGTL